jgi:restriction system protein
MPPQERTWVVRAGRDAAFFDDFRSNSVVALGWREAGPIDAGLDDGAMTALFDRAFPNDKPGSRRVWQAQVRRFLTEMAAGDPVATYDSTGRVYLLGQIAGAPFWRNEHPPRARKVSWTHHVARDVLTASTRNALGSIATFFRANEEASAVDQSGAAFRGHRPSRYRK